MLVVGLGNPGKKYEKTRHNVGFVVLDAIAKDNGLEDFREKFSGLFSKGSVYGADAVLLKPQTFMNESGRAIRAASDFYKCAPENVTVFHDELDLAPMKVKVKRGGGTAGHNGLRSTDAYIGADFRRVRIGIGHPGHKDRVHGYVLSNYHKSEADALSDMLGAIGAEARWLAGGDDARFINDVALRLGE